MMNVIKLRHPSQEHIAIHIFSNLGTHVPFLQLQGYISLKQASGFDSNFATQFLWLATVDIAHLECIATPSFQLAMPLHVYILTEIWQGGTIVKAFETFERGI